MTIDQLKKIEEHIKQREIIEDYLKNRSGVITAQLKELGLEE